MVQRVEVAVESREVGWIISVGLSQKKRSLLSDKGLGSGDSAPNLTLPHLLPHPFNPSGRQGDSGARDGFSAASAADDGLHPRGRDVRQAGPGPTLGLWEAGRGETLL